MANCTYCGYAINLGAANHADCVVKRIADLSATLQDAHAFIESLDFSEDDADVRADMQAGAARITSRIDATLLRKS